MLQNPKLVLLALTIFFLEVFSFLEIFSFLEVSMKFKGTFQQSGKISGKQIAECRKTPKWDPPVFTFASIEKFCSSARFDSSASRPHSPLQKTSNSLMESCFHLSTHPVGRHFWKTSRERLSSRLKSFFLVSKKALLWKFSKIQFAEKYLKGYLFPQLETSKC